MGYFATSSPVSVPWNILSAQAFWFSILLISLPGDE